MLSSCEKLTYWKRPWCWEGLRAEGEGDDRGWDGWMASPTQWSLSELLELVMDRKAWRAAVHGITKSRTRVSNWSELNWNDLSWGTFLFVGPFLHIKILKIKKHENPIWWGGTGRTRDMTRRLCPYGWYSRMLLSWAGPHLFTLSLATSTWKCSREPLKGHDCKVPHLPWLLTFLSHSIFSVTQIIPSGPCSLYLATWRLDSHINKCSVKKGLWRVGVISSFFFPTVVKKKKHLQTLVLTVTL